MAFVCDIGDVAVIQTVFTTSAGATVDPSEVILYLKTPSGTVGTYTRSAAQVSNPAVGTYRYNGTITESGYWSVRWVGTGAAVAADQSRFFARSVNT